MYKILLLLIFICTNVHSQDNLIGKKEISVFENGSVKKKTLLNPQPNNGQQYNGNGNYSGLNNFFGNNTAVRWSFNDATAIGDFTILSGNGKYNVTSWNLNSHRISLYNNLSPTPVWEYPTDPNVYLSFLTISDTGGVIGTGSYQNILLFNNSSNVPFFNFDLTRLADTGIATGLDISNDGKFLVASVSRQDSSTIFGFNSTSNVPVWSRKIIPTITVGGAGIQGVRMSANDSLVIINTYAEFYVIRAYTGQLIFQGLINPSSPSSGTQVAQGISGNGNVISTINYSGFVRVYQWNGTTYNFIWANQEPPGTFFNWYTCVEISDDGQNIAAGTLNFVSSSSFDGKIKLFKTSGTGIPIWTYAGCGDEVSALSFSNNGNILAASSWGEFNNITEDLFIFKTFLGGTPIFKLNTSGSLFYCSTSNDGKTVTASGKAVHARQFGNGGLLFNIDVDTSDIPTSILNYKGSVTGFQLMQNYPNPFNPKTIISYQLAAAGHAALRIFNMSGKEITTLVNENQNAGNYEVEFDAEHLPSGIYFYELKTEAYSVTKKMILIK
ncbi:MAG: T9SS type A sorting domain-containing protein [Ignavibacteria bacterium]